MIGYEKKVLTVMVNNSTNISKANNLLSYQSIEQAKKREENDIIALGRKFWRYQRGNQNPYIEEEQTTQWPKEKVQKDKQRSTKHYT